MKQFLSGSDWRVSHFLPDEAAPVMPWIEQIAQGAEYGASFINAVVPGDVQSDALDAGLIQDINIGYQAREAEWTYQRDWLYVKRFIPAPEFSPGCRCRLCFDGVDDACEVYLNGKWLGDHENVWLPFSMDVTEELRRGSENCLIVIVKAAPCAQNQWGRTSESRHMKPRFAYGWDWCTRLVPLGIWKDVYLKYEHDASIEDLYVYASVDFIHHNATVFCEISLRGANVEGAETEVSIHAPDGGIIGTTVIHSEHENTVTCKFHIEDARLWYPNGMGDQPLYRVSAVLRRDGVAWDEADTVIGLRHIAWRRTKGAADGALPYQPVVNGRPVFLQGYNFTPVRQLYGRENKEAYEKRIGLVRRAGANFLRVNGVGLCEREYFYDLCDRNGILVMQEFCQSSSSINNHPPRDAAYIGMLRKTAASVIRQKRNHPSLAVWCGGNELCFRGEYMNADGEIRIQGAEGLEGKRYDVSGYHWVPLSGDYPTLKALGNVAAALDPQRLWLHTSGSGPVTQNADLKYTGGNMHDVHGPWHVLGPVDHYTLYNRLDMMIHMEFGCNGGASVQALERFLPEPFRWPLDESNPMAHYHGRMWLGNLKQIEPYFGPITDYRTFSLASRFVQWESVRYALEAHRRLDGRCAGAVLWHLAEPWPNVSDTCSVDFADQPKPAYYGEMAAFRPVHLSARYDAVRHDPGEGFRATIALHNAGGDAFTGGARVQVFDMMGTKLFEHAQACYCPADSVVPELFDMCLKELPRDVFFLRLVLEDADGCIMEKSYSVHSPRSEYPYAPLLNQPECSIRVTRQNAGICLHNEGSCVASGVTVECALVDHVYFTDGCVMLLPGESIDIGMEGDPSALYIHGFGVPYHRICAEETGSGAMEMQTEEET